MKKILLALVSVVASLVLPGCFQSETTIHLNKDGSGTLVEETRLGAQMLAMLESMAGLGGEEKAKEDPVAKMFSEDKAKARAAQLGEGVSFEKSEVIKNKDAKGARVTYRFKNINTLKITPGDGFKNVSPMEVEPPAGAKIPKPVGFVYADGQLRITMPAPEKADAPAEEKPGAPDMESPEAQAMMKEMLSDMKMSLKVVVEPGIAESNATHKSGNTITLMEMDMGKLLEKPDTLKILSKVDKNNPAAAMKALKGIEGLKFETQEAITVKVQ
jgi:hypothetical protein